MPKTLINRKLQIIDAEGKAIGRIATAVVEKLLGKNKASYQPHIDVGDFVTVKNIKKVKFTGKKYVQKLYHSHSGYPGGLKTKSLNELFEKEPAKVLKKAVHQMLPNNKLRAQRIKRLAIK